MKWKTYVYERVPYYNPRIRNFRYHYRYLVKKDIGGERKIRSIHPQRSLILSPFVPILKIVGCTGIYDIVKKYLTDKESKEIIAFAESKIVRPLPISSIDTWFWDTSLSQAMNIYMKSQMISALFDMIG